MVKSPQFSDWLKHIELHYHFVRENFDKEEIEIFYIPLEGLMVDLFTKALPSESFTKHMMQMSLKQFDVRGICAKWKIVRIVWPAHAMDSRRIKHVQSWESLYFEVLIPASLNIWQQKLSVGWFEFQLEKFISIYFQFYSKLEMEFPAEWTRSPNVIPLLSI